MGPLGGYSKQPRGWLSDKIEGAVNNYVDALKPQSVSCHCSCGSMNGEAQHRPPQPSSSGAATSLASIERVVQGAAVGNGAKPLRDEEEDLHCLPCAACNPCLDWNGDA